MLLTDTGPLRGGMRACYHRQCDTARPGTPAWADYSFLARTVQTVIDSVADLSRAACPASPHLAGLQHMAPGEEAGWQQEAADVTTLQPEQEDTSSEVQVESIEDDIESEQREGVLEKREIYSSEWNWFGVPTFPSFLSTWSFL